MLKIREDLKTIEEVRREVEKAFSHGVEDVSQALKDKIADAMISNKWAVLKTMNDSLVSAHVKQTVVSLIGGSSTWSAVWRETNWELLDNAEDLIDALNMRSELLFVPNFNNLKNAVFRAKELLKIADQSSYSSYSGGLEIAQQINRNLDSAEFWRDYIETAWAEGKIREAGSQQELEELEKACY